jgi:hypothetical protein
MDPVLGYMKNVDSAAPTSDTLPLSDNYIHWKACKTAIALTNKDVQSHLQVRTLQGHFYIMTILSFVLVKILLL